MTIHTTPPPHADPADPDATEPAVRASRFDERGIALQTVIIIVVMLAIAASVAAVLLTRGSEATNQLASAEVGISAGSITNETLCRGAGHGWDGGCKALASWDGGTKETDAVCKGYNPRWVADTSKDGCKVGP